MALATKLQEKRGPRVGDAASLWNFTPAPGWDKEEVQVLKLCLMKHGVGQWQAILNTGLLPGKMIQQLNGQTQRLLGQQSLAAYTGLQVDVDRIRGDNEARTDVQRKSGLIIRSGPNPTKEMREQWQAEAKAKYGLSPEQLREVDEQLEEMRCMRAHKVGGEGSHTAGVARAPVEDLMGSDASQLSRQLQVQMLRRLRASLMLLVDRLRTSGLGLAPLAGAEEAANNMCALDEAMACDDLAQPGPSSRALAAAGGAKGRRGKSAGGNGRGSVKVQEGGVSKKRPAPGSARKGRRSAAADSSDEDEEAAAMMMDDEGDDEDDFQVPVPSSRRRTGSCGGDARRAAMEAAVEADITSLVEMGFTRGKARTALAEANGVLERAVEWLFANCS